MTAAFSLLSFVLLGLGAMILGGFVLRRGLRGRVIDDHPLCRKCRFDLTGRPDTSTRCPECGGELTAGAIVIGHRRAVRKQVWAGASVLAIGLMISAVLVIATASRINWMSLKPVWWLTMETNSATPATRDAALGEFHRRILAGSLSRSEIDSLVDRALARQADLSKPWAVGWGDLIDAAKATNMLDEARWKRYATQAVDLQLIVRPVVRHGEPLPIMLLIPGRTGRSARLSMNVGITSLKVNGQTISGHSGSFGSGLNNGSNGSMSTVLDNPALRKLPEGEQRHSATAWMNIKQQGATGAADVELAKLEIERSIHWRVIPSDGPTVTPMIDPSKTDAVVAAFKQVRIKRFSHPRWLEINFDTTNLPVPLSHDMFIRAGEKEYLACSITMRGSSGSAGLGTSSNGLPDFELPAKVDLVFRPNPGHAENTVDMTNYWNHEFVIPNVPIQPAAAGQ